ncbi:hypothetical protein CSX00_00010 [Pseudobutyrivibrio ruminis]|uniref:Uncharacterized protein n=1 Tax=Pseudobutyrivibrio ruminis TaxID=46206 RepID=A0A2G3EEA0_9FIRM|nr:hypothetical protein [Pseudobutyrivibrio ruminis]PHU41594.1 hypothetical protein CSX00_00010 [Pseudobutyrivibrio ruminis]
MKKMKLIFILFLLLVLFICGIVYLKSNHHVKPSKIAECNAVVEKGNYGFLYTEDELHEYEINNDIDIQLPDGFDFGNQSILVCGGHELLDAYYNIWDEDDKFSDSHFLYVVLDKQNTNKIYVYATSNRYRSWFYSQRYCDSFDGIKYE